MCSAQEKVIAKHNASFNKALREVCHKFEILNDVEFDILMDVHERTLMFIQYIPKKTPWTSRPPTLVETQMTNANVNEGGARANDEDEVTNNWWSYPLTSFCNGRPIVSFILVDMALFCMFFLC